MVISRSVGHRISPVALTFALAVAALTLPVGGATGKAAAGTDAVVQPPSERESAEPEKAERIDPVLEKHLRHVWQQQLLEVGTAEIRFTRFNWGESSFQPLSWKVVRQMIDESDLAADSSRVKPLIKSLLNSKGIDEWTPNWGTHVFRSVGLKTFEDYHASKLGESGGERLVRLFDGDTDLQFFSANRQLDVCRAGQSPYARLTLKDFRIQLPSDLPSELTVTLLEGNRVRLMNERLEVVADASTGFVRNMVVRDAAGKVYREVWQFRPMSFTGGIIFPQLKIACTYEEETLNVVDTVVVEHFSINEPFEEDAFELKVPGGTLVVDQRKDQHHPSVYRLPEGLKDAAAHLRALQ